VDIAADSAARVFDLNGIDGLSAAYFVRLILSDGSGKQVSANFYWLSTQPDVSDWNRSNGRYTPIQSYANFTALQNLPPVKLKVTSRGEERGAQHVERVLVENPGTNLAFFVHLRLLKGKDGAELAPVIWEDNYFELMPGEKREIAAECHRQTLGAAKPYLKVEGWNVMP
jgi:exo-1,4-beta-D-glucosaminidase